MFNFQRKSLPSKDRFIYIFSKKHNEIEADRLLANKAAQGFYTSLAGAEVLCGTVTMHQRLRRNDGTWQPLTVQEAENVARLIKRNIERNLFGNAVSRFGKQLITLVTLEGRRAGKQLHLHFAIGVPPGRNFSRLQKEFEKAVGALLWTEGRRYTAPPAYDEEGWARYITKEYDTILWHQSNFYFNPA